MKSSAFVYAVMPEGFDKTTLAENEFVGNDQDTLQQAVDYVHNARGDKGGNVYLSIGNYHLQNVAIGNCLRIYNGIRIVGGNTKGKDPNSSATRTTIEYNNLTESGEYVEFSALLQIFAVQVTEETDMYNAGCTIEDIDFIGNCKVDHAIFGQFVKFCNIINCNMYSAGVGIQLSSADYVIITNVNCSVDPREVTQCAGIVLHECNNINIRRFNHFSELSQSKKNLQYIMTMITCSDIFISEISNSSEIYGEDTIYDGRMNFSDCKNIHISHPIGRLTKSQTSTISDIDALSSIVDNTTFVSGTLRPTFTSCENVVLTNCSFPTPMYTTKGFNAKIFITATGCKGFKVSHTTMCGVIKVSGTSGCNINNITFISEIDESHPLGDESIPIGNNPVLQISESPYSVISNVNTQESLYGINVIKSDRSIIENPTCYARYNGIHIDSCSGVIIDGAYASGAEYDILIETSTYCMVFGSRYEMIQYSGQGNKADQGLNNQVNSLL